MAATERLMKAPAAGATRNRNRLEGRSSTFWEGCYKFSPVQTETYRLGCARCIELNPVLAGWCQRPVTTPGPASLSAWVMKSNGSTWTWHTAGTQRSRPRVVFVLLNLSPFSPGSVFGRPHFRALVAHDQRRMARRLASHSPMRGKTNSIRSRWAKVRPMKAQNKTRSGTP